MLPNPVYPFGRFISKIAAVEVAAQEEKEMCGLTVLRPDLPNFRGFLLAPLVDVCKIARRFRFNQNWETVRLHLLGLNDYVYRNVDVERFSDDYIHAEVECSGGHLIDGSRWRMRPLLVSLGYQVF